MAESALSFFRLSAHCVRLFVHLTNKRRINKKHKPNRLHPPIAVARSFFCFWCFFVGLFIQPFHHLLVFFSLSTHSLFFVPRISLFALLLRIPFFGSGIFHLTFFHSRQLLNYIIAEMDSTHREEERKKSENMREIDRSSRRKWALQEFGRENVKPNLCRGNILKQNLKLTVRESNATHCLLCSFYFHVALHNNAIIHSWLQWEQQSNHKVHILRIFYLFCHHLFMLMWLGSSGERERVDASFCCNFIRFIGRCVAATAVSHIRRTAYLNTTAPNSMPSRWCIMK